MLCFRNFPVAKKFMDKNGGGEYQELPSKNFCLTVPKNSVGKSFSVSLISGIEKLYAQEGNVTIFYRKFVVSQYRKTSYGSTSVFYKTSGVQETYGYKGRRREGVSRFSVEKFFVSQCQKNS